MRERYGRSVAEAMTACPKHREAVLYTPIIRRTGRTPFTVPIGWCFVCFEELGVNAAIYFSRPMLAAAYVDSGVSR